MLKKELPEVENSEEKGDADKVFLLVKKEIALRLVEIAPFVRFEAVD